MYLLGFGKFEEHIAVWALSVGFYLVVFVLYCVCRPGGPRRVISGAWLWPFGPWNGFLEKTPIFVLQYKISYKFIERYIYK